MKLEYIQQQVANINAISDDFESAHICEDELRDEFIKYVASTDNVELATKARAVLETIHLCI